MILRFSDLKSNLGLIFPLNRLEIAELTTSNHGAICYYTVDIELFLIFNFPLRSMKFLYEFRTSEVRDSAQRSLKVIGLSTLKV